MIALMSWIKEGGMLASSSPYVSSRENREKHGKGETHVTVGLLESLGSLLLVTANLLHQDLDVLLNSNTCTRELSTAGYLTKFESKDTDLLVNLSGSGGVLGRVLGGGDDIDTLELGNVIIIILLGGTSLLLLLLSSGGGLGQLSSLVLVVRLGLSEND